MEQPLRVDLHARRVSDLRALRPVLDALRELGESADLSVSEALEGVDLLEARRGAQSCELRVLVEGPAPAPSPPGRLVVLVDDLEPVESAGVSDALCRAELVLVPGASQVDPIAARVPGEVIAAGLPRLDPFLADPVGARSRARHALGLDAQRQLVLWAPSLGRPRWADEMLSRLKQLGATIAVEPTDWPEQEIEYVRADAARRPDLIIPQPRDVAVAIAAADLVISNHPELLREARVLGKSVIRIQGDPPEAGGLDLERWVGVPAPGPEAVERQALVAMGQRVKPPVITRDRWVAEPGTASHRVAALIQQRLIPVPAPDASRDGEEMSNPAESIVPGSSGFFESISARVAFGDVESAIGHLEAYLAEQPSAEGHRLLASVRRGQNEIDPARQQIEIAEELARIELARVLCELARVEVEAGHGDAARKAFGEANRMSPTLADPLIGLGSLALHQGEAVVAEDHFRDALQIEKSARAWAGLGLALATLRRGREAVEVLETALDLDPDSGAAIHGLVQASFQTGDLKVAEARVRAYVDGHPASLDMIFTLAGLCHQLGDGAGALEALEKIEIFDPGYSGLSELREKVLAS